MEVADLVAKFRAEGDENVIRALGRVDRGIQNVGDSSVRAGSKLGSVFSVAGGILSAAAIGGIFEIGKGLLNASANAETAKMALETVTGSQERALDLYKNVQEFAKSTPFAFPELVDATINMEAFGMDSTKWLTTIGDTAAAMNKSVDQVVQATLDASMGEFERLKELGIKARVEGDKVLFTYMENGKEMTKEADKNSKEMMLSTIQGIWNDKYEGAMEKQAKTFTGQWSTLKDNINMSLQEMTGGIFGFVTRSLGFFNDIFANGFVATIRDRFGPGAAEFVANFGTMAQGVIDAFGEGTPVKEIVDKLPESWQPVGEAVLLAADAFGQMWTNLTQGDWGGLAEDLQQLASAGVDLGKLVISGTIELAGDLAGGFWQKVKNYAGIGEGDGTGGPEPGLPPMDIGEILVSAVIKLAGDLADIGAAIERELTAQSSAEEVEKAREAGRQRGEAIAAAFAEGFNSAGNADGTGGAGLGYNVDTWSEGIAALLFPPSMFIDDPIFIDEWVAFGEGAAEGIMAAIGTGIENKFASETADAIDWVATGADIFETIKTGMDIALAELGELKISWPNDWKVDFDIPVIGEFPSWNDIFNLAWDGLKALGGLTSPWPNSWKIDFSMPSLGIFPSWNDIFNLVWSGLKGLGGLSIGWPNSFSINMPSPNISGPDVPFFAKGGRAPGGLAMVGERGPELVSLPRGAFVHTAGQTAAMMRAANGGGGGATIVNISLAGAMVGRGARAELQQLITQYGGQTLDRKMDGRAIAGARA